MSFAVIVVDMDSGSVRLVSVSAIETEGEAREALASWWAEQPASVHAASKPYVLDLERLTPVLIVPVADAEPCEGVGFLPEDPTRQTREAYEEPLDPPIEEVQLVEDALVEEVVVEEVVVSDDAGAFVAEEPPPPAPPAVDEIPSAGPALDDVLDSFIGEADETESALEEIAEDEAVPVPEADEVFLGDVVEEPIVVEEIPEEAAAAEAEDQSTDGVVDEVVVEGVEDHVDMPGASDAESIEVEELSQEPPPDVEEPAPEPEMSYYGSTGLAPVAGLAEEPELEVIDADDVGEDDAGDITPESVEFVADEPPPAEAAMESDWHVEAGPDGQLTEYAAVEEPVVTDVATDEPAAYEPAVDEPTQEAEPAASWPWELEDDSPSAAEPAASDAGSSAAPEVREPLGARETQSGAEAALPAIGTATATATEEAESQTDTSAGAYEPGSLDMETYTCDDCVYEGTCPKKGEETPASCGSFQWRAS